MMTEWVAPVGGGGGGGSGGFYWVSAGYPVCGEVGDLVEFRNCGGDVDMGWVAEAVDGEVVVDGGGGGNDEVLVVDVGLEGGFFLVVVDVVDVVPAVDVV